MIDTILGPMDEANLTCETVAFDGPQYYAYERRYRLRGGDQVIASYHDVKWEKKNEFQVSPPGGVYTSRGHMTLDRLAKSTGAVDNGTEYSCWVEYRPLGEEEIVHRSAHTKLKTPPSTAPIFAYAGKV